MNHSVDRTHDRMALLVRAGEMFHRSLDVDDTLANVAQMAVESFADVCLFDAIDDESERLYVTAGAHRDPAKARLLKKLGSSVLQGTDFDVHPAVRVTETGQSYFVPVLNDETIPRYAASLEHADFMRTMGYRSKIVVPVVAHERVFGALTFVRTAGAEPFDERDVQAAEELGRRAGLAVANAKQFHRERHVAATLQSAFLLKDFPSKPGLSFHALYRPGKNDAELGGDWYDAFETPDGYIVATIGDVTGSGIEAARIMVQLRQAVRVAATISRDPAEILRIINRALLLDKSEALATAFVGVVSPDCRSLRYVSAGHPPAFVRWGNGAIETLALASPPLGISDEVAFEPHEVSIEGSALLVLYTDGITEVTKDAIAGEAMLRRVLESEAVVHAANPARFVERAVARESLRDDIAIMTLRFGGLDRQWRFDVGDPAAAYAIRRDFIKSICDVADPADNQLEACELIFGELIGNAVRYAPGPLSISVCADDDGELVLHLIDEGPGFEPRPALPRDLWAESGRGLYLIAELSRGIEVSRLPGYGSYIRVRLPVVPRRAALPERV